MKNYIEKKPREILSSRNKVKIIFLNSEAAADAQKKSDEYQKKYPRKKTCRFVDNNGNIIYYKKN